MNYYIQGDAARAEQIKAAFKAKGISDGGNSFIHENYLYFSEGGEVDFCSIGGHIANIIKTHPDYKELELPVKPKFKVGDDIETGNTIDTIAEIGYDTRSYYCESGRTISFENQDLWHLVPKKHYAIANFHAGMPVLVRDDESDDWRYIQFSHTRIMPSFRFVAGGCAWRQCIPFNEETKHLLGTTDMPSEEYINW